MKMLLASQLVAAATDTETQTVKDDEDEDDVEAFKQWFHCCAEHDECAIDLRYSWVNYYSVWWVGQELP